MRGTSGLAEKLLSSKIGMYSTELVGFSVS